MRESPKAPSSNLLVFDWLFGEQFLGFSFHSQELKRWLNDAVEQKCRVYQ